MVVEAIVMATTDGPPRHSALDAALDIFRMRQYFNVVARARDVAAAIGKDAAFLGTVRRGMLPLPFDRRPAPGHVFGPLRGAAPPPLAGSSAFGHQPALWQAAVVRRRADQPERAGRHDSPRRLCAAQLLSRPLIRAFTPSSGSGALRA